METTHNILFTRDTLLNLELDFENIKTEDYYDILSILKYCPSLVNDDVLSISEEILSRLHARKIIQNRKNCSLINKLYSMLYVIHNTETLRSEFTSLCPWLSTSPSVSPVATPKIMKKEKRRSYRGTKKFRQLDSPHPEVNPNCLC